MKKIISILMIIGLLFVCASCGGASPEKIDEYISQGEYEKAVKAGGMTVESLKECIANHGIEFLYDINDVLNISRIDAIGIKGALDNYLKLTCCIKFNRVDDPDTDYYFDIQMKEDEDGIFFQPRDSIYCCNDFEEYVIRNGEKETDEIFVYAAKQSVLAEIESNPFSEKEVEKINKNLTNGKFDKKIDDTVFTAEQLIAIFTGLA